MSLDVGQTLNALGVGTVGGAHAVSTAAQSPLLPAVANAAAQAGAPTSAINQAIGAVSSAGQLSSLIGIVAQLPGAAMMVVYGLGVLYFFYLVNTITMFIQSACQEDSCRANTRSAVLWMTLIAVVGSLIPLGLAGWRFWSAFSELEPYLAMAL